MSPSEIRGESSMLLCYAMLEFKKESDLAVNTVKIQISLATEVCFQAEADYLMLITFKRMACAQHPRGPDEGNSLSSSVPPATVQSAQKYSLQNETRRL